MPLTPGSRVGTCEIIGSLGEGGMGVVYRARDLRLSRDVAIKLVSEKIADDPQHRARLDREAQALAALNHPNIAQIYGVADTSDGPALLMELVEGPTLAEVIKAGAVTTTMFAQIATQLLAALEYAHGAGVIHRDLKPANIKLRADSVIKVLDFGLAKRQSPSSVDASAASSPTTITDSTYGTPENMAPELLRGAPAARSSDIFAIGVLLFELATRQRPFHRGSVFQTAEAILNDAEPGWPAGSPFSDSVQQVISRAMAKDAIVRYGSVAELRTALADALSTSPIVPRKPTPTSRKQVRAIAVALAVAVALLGVGVLRSVVPAEPDTASIHTTQHDGDSAHVSRRRSRRRTCA